MNPLAYYKCAQRVLMALAAISGIFLAASCGSSSIINRGNSVGFNNSNLSGTYVFSTEGVDSSGGFITIAGALTANGSGTISGGNMDVVGVDVSPLSQALTGSYSVGTDGRGQAKISAGSIGNITFDFVLTSSSHGLITEFDGNGTGSGTLDLQTTPITSLSQLAGSYAFGLAGIDSNSDPLATAGSFTLNTNGTSTAGVEDFTVPGINYLAETLTASTTLGSGTAPGSIILSTSFGVLTFDFYPIDATHLKFIETDYSEILLGDVFSQSGATIPTGQAVFTMSGGTNTSGPVAIGGVFISDASGDMTGGLEDVNSGGTVSPSQVSFTGSAASGGSVGGRVLVNLTGFIPATQLAIYPSTGGLIMLETDISNVMLGTAYAQTGTTLAGSQNYGFNLSAINLGNGSGAFEEDDIAQFLTATTSFTGIVDINDEGSLSYDQKFAGTYSTPDSTGRGTATTTANGNGYVSFDYYMVNSSTALLVETDQSQVGVGSFALQNSGANPTMSRMLMARPMVHSKGAFHARKTQK
jgi:hypothetical protein